MAYLSRDPFARTELHRERVDMGVFGGGCTWCGQLRWTKAKRPRPYLYGFRTESDGGRSSPHRGVFCSKSCHNAYHCG